MMWWVLENTVSAGLIAIFAFAMCRLVRVRPAWCHLIWLLALIKLLMPPVSTDVWPPAQFRGLWTSSPPEVETTAAPRFEDAKFYNLYRWREMEAESAARENENAYEVAEESGARVREKRATEETKALAESPFQPAAPPQVAIKAPAPIQPIMTARTTAPAKISIQPPQSNREMTSASTAFLFTIPILIVLWLCGSMVIIAQQVVAIHRTMRVKRSAHEAPEELRTRVGDVAQQLNMRAPAVVVSADVVSPFVWAVGRPTFFCPRDMVDTFSSNRGRGVIAHELAHIKRFDHWVAWIELAGMAAWWWNPVFWVIRNRLRTYAELACDAWALDVQSGEERSHRRAYAEALIDLSEQISRSVMKPAPVAALGVCETDKRSFERRLMMILNERVSARVPLRFAMALGIAAVLVLPSWTRAASTPDEKDKVTEQARTTLVDEGIERAARIQMLKNKAGYAADNDDWNTAADAFAALSELEPDNGHALHMLGYSLIQIGDYDGAVEAFSKQVDGNHRREVAAYNLGCAYSLKGEKEKALKYLDKAVKCGFMDETLWQEDGDLDNVRESTTFEEYMDSVSKVNSMRIEAEEAYRAEEYEAAVEVMEHINEICPDSGVSRAYLARACLAAGKPEKALEAAKRQVELGYETGQAHRLEAVAWAGLGDYKAAAKHLRMAAELGAVSAADFAAEGELAAFNECTECEELRTNLSAQQALRKEAASAWDDRDLEAAAKAYAKIVDAEPDNGEALHRLGYASIYLGELKQGRECFLREARLGHEMPRAVYNIACCDSLAGNIDSGFAHLERAIDLGFNQGELIMTDTDLDALRNADTQRFRNLATRVTDRSVLEQFGVRDWPTAYEIYSERVKEDPEDGRAHHRLGWAQLRLGQYEDAVKSFTTQYELGFARGIGAYNIACGYALMDRTDDAIEWLDKAAEEGGVDPEHAKADPDLANIHDDPRFEKVLEKMSGPRLEGGG